MKSLPLSHSSSASATRMRWVLGSAASRVAQAIHGFR